MSTHGDVDTEMTEAGQGEAVDRAEIKNMMKSIWQGIKGQFKNEIVEELRGELVEEIGQEIIEYEKDAMKDLKETIKKQLMEELKKEIMEELNGEAMEDTEEEVTKEIKPAGRKGTKKEPTEAQNRWNAALEAARKYIGPITTDADPTHRPTVTTEKPAFENRNGHEKNYLPTYLQKIKDRWLEKGGNKYLDVRLPAGYALWTHTRTSKKYKHHQGDRRLYGHPDRYIFHSFEEFYPHWTYLVARTAVNGAIGPELCPCKYCKKATGS